MKETVEVDGGQEDVGAAQTPVLHLLAEGAPQGRRRGFNSPRFEHVAEEHRHGFYKGEEEEKKVYEKEPKNKLN